MISCKLFNYITNKSIICKDQGCRNSRTSVEISDNPNFGRRIILTFCIVIQQYPERKFEVSMFETFETFIKHISVTCYTKHLIQLQRNDYVADNVDSISLGFNESIKRKEKITNKLKTKKQTLN